MTSVNADSPFVDSLASPCSGTRFDDDLFGGDPNDLSEKEKRYRLPADAVATFETMFWSGTKHVNRKLAEELNERYQLGGSQKVLNWFANKRSRSKKRDSVDMGSSAQLLPAIVAGKASENGGSATSRKPPIQPALPLRMGPKDSLKQLHTRTQSMSSLPFGKDRAAVKASELFWNHDAYPMVPEVDKLPTTTAMGSASPQQLHSSPENSASDHYDSPDFSSDVHTSSPIRAGMDLPFMYGDSPDFDIPSHGLDEPAVVPIDSLGDCGDDEFNSDTAAPPPKRRMSTVDLSGLSLNPSATQRGGESRDTSSVSHRQLPDKKLSFLKKRAQHMSLDFRSLDENFRCLDDIDLDNAFQQSMRQHAAVAPFPGVDTDSLITDSVMSCSYAEKRERLLDSSQLQQDFNDVVAVLSRSLFKNDGEVIRSIVLFLVEKVYPRLQVILDLTMKENVNDAALLSRCHQILCAVGESFRLLRAETSFEKEPSHHVAQRKQLPEIAPEFSITHHRFESSEKNFFDQIVKHHVSGILFSPLGTGIVIRNDVNAGLMCVWRHLLISIARHKLSPRDQVEFEKMIRQAARHDMDGTMLCRLEPSEDSRNAMFLPYLSQLYCSQLVNAFQSDATEEMFSRVLKHNPDESTKRQMFQHLLSQKNFRLLTKVADIPYAVALVNTQLNDAENMEHSDCAYNVASRIVHRVKKVCRNSQQASAGAMANGNAFKNDPKQNPFVDHGDEQDDMNTRVAESPEPDSVKGIDPELYVHLTWAYHQAESRLPRIFDAFVRMLTDELNEHSQVKASLCSQGGSMDCSALHLWKAEYTRQMLSAKTPRQMARKHWDWVSNIGGSPQETVASLSAFAGSPATSKRQFKKGEFKGECFVDWIFLLPDQEQRMVLQSLKSRIPPHCSWLCDPQILHGLPNVWQIDEDITDRWGYLRDIALVLRQILSDRAKLEPSVLRSYKHDKFGTMDAPLVPSLQLGSWNESSLLFKDLQ
eukprot:ANDGO_01148.mRNA.1 hypothetical protein